MLTDGGDQGSQETFKTATEAAQKANAIIYVILIADRGFYGGGFGINLADTGAVDMERLAKDTGGRVINVGNNGKKLEDAFDQIQDELRTQYLAQLHPHQPQGRRHLPQARPHLRQAKRSRPAKATTPSPTAPTTTSTDVAHDSLISYFTLTCARSTREARS